MLNKHSKHKKVSVSEYFWTKLFLTIGLNKSRFDRLRFKSRKQDLLNLQKLQKNWKDGLRQLHQIRQKEPKSYKGRKFFGGRQGKSPTNQSYQKSPKAQKKTRKPGIKEIKISRVCSTGTLRVLFVKLDSPSKDLTRQDFFHSDFSRGAIFSIRQGKF